MKKKRRKIILIATALVIIELLSPKKYNAEVLVDIVSTEEGYFANYRYGKVYIGDKNYIRSIKDQVDEDDILIIDKRDNENPDFQVVGSYRIKDAKVRDDIIYIIQMYNLMYPKYNWSRTESSMRNEWEIHNFLYQINYELSHTTDVDFDIEDEEKYNSKILTNILHN